MKDKLLRRGALYCGVFEYLYMLLIVGDTDPPTETKDASPAKSTNTATDEAAIGNEDKESSLKSAEVDSVNSPGTSADQPQHQSNGNQPPLQKPEFNHYQLQNRPLSG